jgi:tetrahydrodipicolinate N-succinyltransferase
MNVEDMKKKIIELIDDSKDNDRKIGFYSDENVQTIMEELYRKWEAGNRRGIPLDYATRDQIEILYKLAVYYSRNPRGKAYVEFVRRAYYGDKKEKKQSSTWKKILRFI